MARPPRPVCRERPLAALLGIRMRELRRTAGVSFASLAARTGADRRRLGEIESGHALPTAELLDRIDHTLDARGALIRLLPDLAAEHHEAVRLARARRRGRRLQWRTTDPAVIREAHAHWRSGRSVLRRDFVRDVATVAGLATAPPLHARANAEVPLSPALPSRLVALTTDYRRLDCLAGPGAVRGTVNLHYARILDYLKRVRERRLRRELAVAGCDAAELAGWLAMDEARYPEAAGWYGRAAELARLAGHVGLLAYTHGRMSRLLSHCGDHRGALVYAQRAAELAGSHSTPGTRLWLAATRAFVDACQRNESACHRHLDLARACAEHLAPDEEPAWMSFCTPAYITKWAGHSYLELGRGRSAYQIFSEAAAHWDPTSVREHAEVLGRLAGALIQQGEIDEACRTLGRAHHIAVSTESSRNLRTLRTLRTTLQPWAGARAVRELDERLTGGYG
ncbi:MAG: helix-turn-helix domain-containing protein [Streptomycetales bacterium]